MATRELRTCDAKGCNEEAAHFSLPRGRKLDAAGSSSDVNRYFDLCPMHTAAVARKALEGLEWDAQDALLELFGVPVRVG